MSPISAIVTGISRPFSVQSFLISLKLEIATVVFTSPRYTASLPTWIPTISLELMSPSCARISWNLAFSAAKVDASGPTQRPSETLRPALIAAGTTVVPWLQSVRLYRRMVSVMVLSLVSSFAIWSAFLHLVASGAQSGPARML
uniref:Uncharacterized protein n=1 Tax=Globisporangium ultimum (strain ATCC 200006 / CBS 805.95 / DAOM BR144) TaxID=431595 RepID=K3WMY4_GLOUD